MSRVARSARVASRQRPESITGAKTISAAETGELFLLNYNSGSTIVLTLPPVQEGAYFRFQITTAMSVASSQINIQASGTDKIKGTIVVCDYHASNNVDVATNKDDGNDTMVQLIGNSNTIHVGSYVDIYCDGTDWQASGVVIADAKTQAVFA